LFDSSDITTLAEGVNAANDRITTEEVQAKSFKDGIISSLGSIGTGSTDNSYTYSSPKDLTSDSDLGNFQNVINGSQAITGYPTGTKDADGNEITLDKMQATDKDGKLLYYTDDTALNNKDLTSVTNDVTKITIGTGKTVNNYIVYCKPATANNLTIGSAAWVDGKIVKGTGDDNTTFYNKGSNSKQYAVSIVVGGTGNSGTSLSVSLNGASVGTDFYAGSYHCKVVSEGSSVNDVHWGSYTYGLYVDGTHYGSVTGQHYDCGNTVWSNNSTPGSATFMVPNT
jgi:hypothetical protein